MSAALDAAVGDPYYTGSLLPADVRDVQQIAPFTPTAAQTAGLNYYEALIGYGITRAIDNRFAPAPVQGNTQPGSFGGANGRTYTQAPNGTGLSVLGGNGSAIGGVSPLLLIAGLGLVAFLALR